MIIDSVELRRRHLLRIAGVRDSKVYIGPEVVGLDITNSCNLRCQYCVSTHALANPHHVKKTRLLTWKMFLEIVSDCVDLSVDQINIQGDGEPSLHPLWRDMLGYLADQPLKVVLLTNGTFPLEHCLDVIKVDQVMINISAVDRQQYLALHGEDSFNRVMSNIERLVSLRDVAKPGLQVDVMCIVNNMNIDQRESMKELASQLGIHEVYFMKMIATEYNQKIALPKDNIRGGGESVSSACLNGWFYVLVRPSGNFSICEQTAYAHPVMLKRTSLKQFWLSGYMMKMRLFGQYGYIQKKLKACQTCSFYEKNRGGFLNQGFWKQHLINMQFKSELIDEDQSI